MSTIALKEETVATGAAPADALMTQQGAMSTGAPEHSGSHTKPHLTPPETPTYTPLEEVSEFAATAAKPHHVACMAADARPLSGFAAEVSKAINFFAQHGSEDGDSAHTICVVHAGMHESPEHSDPTTPRFMPNDASNDGQCMALMHVKSSQKIEAVKARKEDTHGLVEITKEKSMHVSHASVPHVEASMFTTYSSADNVGASTKFLQDFTRNITSSVEKTTGALTSSEDSNLRSPFAGVNLAAKNDGSAAESSLFGSAMSSISVSALSAQDEEEAPSGAISIDDLPRNSLVFAWMNPPTEVQGAVPIDGSHSTDALCAVGVLDDNPQGESQSGTDRGCASITIEGNVPSSYPAPNPSTTSLLSQQNTLATSASGDHSISISSSTRAIVSALCRNSSKMLQPDTEGEVSSTREIATASTEQLTSDVAAPAAYAEQGAHAASCVAPVDLPRCTGAEIDGSMVIANAGGSADSRVIANAGSAAGIEGANAGSAAGMVIVLAGIAGASGSAAGGSSSRLLCNDRDFELSGVQVGTQTQQITSPAQPPSTPPSDCTSSGLPSMDVVTPPALPPIRTTQATPEITNAAPLIPRRRSQDSTQSIRFHQHSQKLLPAHRSLRSIINDACHAAYVAESGASSASCLQSQRMRPYSFMEALRWIKQAVDALHKLHTASPQVVHGGLTSESLVLCSSKGSGQNIEVKGFGPDHIPHCSGSEDFETLALPENSPQRKVQAQQQPSGLTVGDKRSLEAVETTGWETVSLHKHKLLYRAPEVLTGAKCDSKGDIFSLGVIMYELFTMRPFATTACIGRKHATVGEYLSRVHGGYREALDASWPQGLRQTIGMCWHDCPEIRPTAEQLRDLLETLEPSIVQMDARFGSSSTSIQVSGGGAVKQSTKSASRFKLPWKRSKA